MYIDLNLPVFPDYSRGKETIELADNLLILQIILLQVLLGLTKI